MKEASNNLFEIITHARKLKLLCSSLIFPPRVWRQDEHYILRLYLSFLRKYTDIRHAALRGGEPSFYPFFCEKKLPQTDYCENKIIMQTIPQSSSMTAPFTQGSLIFARYTSSFEPYIVVFTVFGGYSSSKRSILSDNVDAFV